MTKSVGVRPQRADIVTSADLDKALAAVVRQRAQALLVYPLPLTPVEFQRITEFAIKNRLPTATWYPAYGRAGLMMFYGTNVSEQFRRAGGYIDKILKGAQPADLPVEQPTTFELAINLKTAKALGLTIPNPSCYGQTG